LLVEESPDRHDGSTLIPELARGGCVTNVQPSRDLRGRAEFVYKMSQSAVHAT
jgi:hypothetical protein